VGEWIEIELVEEPDRQRRVALERAVPKPPRHPPRLEGRNRRLVGIGAAAAVVIGIGWAVSRAGGDVSTGAPSATLDDESANSAEQRAVDTTQPAPSTTRPRTTTTTGPPVVVEEFGGPLLPAPTGIALVGFTTDGDLLDIDLDTGQMTTTDLRGSSGNAQATIVAGADWTYVQPWDGNSSFVVPRGQTPVDVASNAPFYGGGVFRGPDPNTMWTIQIDPSSGSVGGLDLVGLDGESLGRSIDLGGGWWPTHSDLAGGLIMQAGGGVYIVSEVGARRIAAGEFVGAGVNHLLVRACDEVLACGLFVVDRVSGEQRQVPGIEAGAVAQFYGWTGTESAAVSPDGTAAISFGLDESEQVLSLVSTDTGEHRPLTRVTESLSVAWSDDSRFVVVNHDRTLVAYDRDTGSEVSLDIVPPLFNFVARP
jgi:hypothetical protein